MFKKLRLCLSIHDCWANICCWFIEVALSWGVDCRCHSTTVAEEGAGSEPLVHFDV